MTPTRPFSGKAEWRGNKKLRGIVALLVWYAREIWWYAGHIVRRTSYADYYAHRMNNIVRRNANWGLNLDRKFQLDYLVKNGMSREAKLLDYGCGALGAGLHFIEYLNAGRYHGADISSEAIAEGRRRITAQGLSSKRPEIVLIRGTSLAAFGDKQFDIVWAQSVLTHMPPEDIESLMRELRDLLTKGGKFYATFARTEGKSHSKRFKDWYHPRDLFIRLGAAHNYQVDFPSGWHHPDDDAGVDTLVVFTA